MLKDVNDAWTNANQGGHDPAPISETVDFTVIEGRGPVLISAPHTGTWLPQGFVPDDWITEKRHDVSNWGTAEMVDALRARLPHASFLHTDLSRLIVDFNRTKEEAITYTSEETGEPIPGNQNLSAEEMARRHNIYDAYMAAQDDLISKLKAQYGGVLFLDIHSFAPNYDGKSRPFEIGSLRPTQNRLSNMVEQKAAQTFGAKRFAANAPYDLSEREKNVIASLVRKHNIPYVGLEFRQDLLEADENIDTFVRFIEETTIEAVTKIYPKAQTNMALAADWLP